VQVRKAAVGIITGLTAAADGREQLQPVQAPLIVALLRLAPSTDTSLSKSALTSLVNLAQDERWAAVLLQQNVVGRVMEFIREKSCPHMDLMVSYVW